MKGIRAAVMVTAVLGAGYAGTATVHANSGATTFSCGAGQEIPAGTYPGLNLYGLCFFPSSSAATITVKGTLTVQPGASLFANYPAGAMGPSSPEGDATLVVWGDTKVQIGATLFLGCGPTGGCAKPTSDQLHGNLISQKALGTVVAYTSISGNVSYHGGGGGRSCLNPTGNPAFGHGVYSDLSSNFVGGKVSVYGLNSCWFGMFRNEIVGTVTVDHNSFADPDATEIGTNTIGGNLSCYSNIPKAQFGDSVALPNTVLGTATGECAALL